MAIQIITDSSSDLPLALIEGWNIKVVPLTVRFEEQVMAPDMPAQEFYAKMKENRVLPTTASPSPEAFCRAVRESDPEADILIVTISTPLSSTYQSAVCAKQMLLEEGFARRIEVVDSRTASMGLGLIACRAAQAGEDGASYDTIVESVKRWTQETKTFFFLDTLENVIKGGRLDRLKGTVATLLNIKLLMKADDSGGIEVLEKVRGSKAALQRIVDKIVEQAKISPGRILAIAHSNCETKAEELLSKVRKSVTIETCLIGEMGPVIGTYAGEGGLMVAY